MTDRDLSTLVTRALREQAAAATVTTAAAAERTFWARRSPWRSTTRRAAMVLATAAVVLVVLLLGVTLMRGTGDGRQEPIAPAVPTRTVSPDTIPSSVADSTAHLIGNGTVVDDRLWFVLDNRLVITDVDGRQVKTWDLPAGTDGEALCCVRDAGEHVVVPTGIGYSFRKAETGDEVATTESRAAGPAAGVGDGVWVRTDDAELALVSPATGRTQQTLRVSEVVDVLAADARRLYVASRSSSTVVGIDPGSGDVEWSHRLGSPPSELLVSGGLVYAADEEGGLTVLSADSGVVRQSWQVPSRSQGPRPRLSVASGAVLWSPDAGTVVRLRTSDGTATGAVAVGLSRRWDNADQQRNGLYVTTAGIWVPTRNDADDYEFHRLPLSLLEP